MGHNTLLNPLDRAAMSRDLIRRFTLTGTPDDLRARLADLAARGATEIGYRLAGPDVERELTAFARMAGLAAR